MDKSILNNSLNEFGFRVQALDYVNSENPGEIDAGIRDTIRGIRLSHLAMGISLAKIKNNRLFKMLGFVNIKEYVLSLSNDYKTESSSIYTWLRVGEVYLKYNQDLNEIGFNDNDGPIKLLFLECALENRNKEDVLNNIKTMTVREFRKYSRGARKAE